MTLCLDYSTMRLSGIGMHFYLCIYLLPSSGCSCPRMVVGVKGEKCVYGKDRET